MSKYRRHPGVVYFHRIWRTRERIWNPDHGGFCNLYVIVREEVDVDSVWVKQGRGRRATVEPARGYKRIFDALDELPRCCSCLYEASWASYSGCNQQILNKQLAIFNKLLNTVATSGKAKKGEHVANLIAKAYGKGDLLIGDIHPGNVGLRRHSLSKWKVPRHNKLVITDLGDLGQPPMVIGSYPKIPEL
jgi:hypothetical protein